MSTKPFSQHEKTQASQQKTKYGTYTQQKRKKPMKNQPTDQSSRRQHEDMQNMLVVAQVKANQQNATSDLSKSFTNGLVATQRAFNREAPETIHQTQSLEKHENPRFAYQDPSNIQLQKDQLKRDSLDNNNNKEFSIFHEQQYQTTGKMNQTLLWTTIKDKGITQLQSETALQGTESSESNQIIVAQGAPGQNCGLGSAYPGSSFDITAALLEDQRAFMKSYATKPNQKRRQPDNRFALWSTQQDAKRSGESSVRGNNYEVDEKSSMTINTQQLNLIEDKAETNEQKMQANLYREFHQMQKFIKDGGPDGVTGTRVKTFTGHPSDLLKVKPDMAKKQPNQGFNQLKQNEIQVAQHRIKAQQRAQSVMNKSGQGIAADRDSRSTSTLNAHGKKRVIMIQKNDPYKLHEPSRKNPRWLVPTSKKIQKTSVSPPKQNYKIPSKLPASRKTSTQTCIGGDIKIEQQISEEEQRKDKVRQTQAYFYRTTRSSHLAHQEFPAQNTTPSEGILAIDYRNTINLQKVIDQYYDGDLQLDKSHNGDLHSMQKAQNHSKVIEEMSQQPTSSAGGQKTCMDTQPVVTARVDSDLAKEITNNEQEFKNQDANNANNNATGCNPSNCNVTVMSSIVSNKVQTVFSKAKKSVYNSQDSGLPDATSKFANNNQLKGRKLKQSEMRTGFRVPSSHHNSMKDSANFGLHSSSKRGFSQSSKATSSLNVKQEGVRLGQERDTIEPSDYNIQQSYQRNKSILEFGPLPNYQIKSRAHQNHAAELMPQMNQNVDHDSAFSFQTKHHSGYASRRLSRKYRTPNETNSQHSAPDNTMESFTHPAQISTVYKGDSFIDDPQPFNKDLNQVIKHDPQVVSDFKRSASPTKEKPQDSLTVERSNWSVKQVVTKEPPSVNTYIDEGVNFGVSGVSVEHIKEKNQNRESAKEQQITIQRKNTRNQLSKNPLNKQKTAPSGGTRIAHKKKFKDYCGSVEDKPISKGRTSLSGDLRTLSREDDIQTISNSHEFQTGFGRTPVNRDAPLEIEGYAFGYSFLDQQQQYLATDQNTQKKTTKRSNLNSNKSMTLPLDNQGHKTLRSTSEKRHFTEEPQQMLDQFGWNVKRGHSDAHICTGASLVPHTVVKNASTFGQKTQTIEQASHDSLPAAAAQNVNLEQGSSENQQDSRLKNDRGIVLARVSVSKQQQLQQMRMKNSDFDQRELFEQFSEKQDSSIGAASPSREALVTPIYVRETRPSGSQNFTQHLNIARIRSNSVLLTPFTNKQRSQKEKRASSNQSKNQQSPDHVGIPQNQRRSNNFATAKTDQVPESTTKSLIERQINDFNINEQLLKRRQIPSPSLIKLQVPPVMATQTVQKTPKNLRQLNTPSALNHRNKDSPKLLNSGRKHTPARKQSSNEQRRVASAKRNLAQHVVDSGEKLQAIVNETLALDVKTDIGEAIDKKRCQHVKNSGLTSPFVNSGNPLLDGMAQNSKDHQTQIQLNQQHSLDVATDFKMAESDLNEDGKDFVEQRGNKAENSTAELTVTQSPIRVQTTTINKAGSQASKYNVSGEETGATQHDNNSPDLKFKLSGTVSYSSKQNMLSGLAMRPATTSIGQRQSLRMSQVQVPIADLSFAKSMTRVGNITFKKISQCGQYEILSSQKEQYGARDPYISYLQQAETNDFSKLRETKEDFLDQNANEVGNQTTNHNKNTDSHSLVNLSNQGRPKTSMHQWSSISRELKQAKDQRNNSQLLKRNISMNRRKQQLILKGQLERQKRIERLGSCSSKDDKKHTSVLPQQQQVAFAQLQESPRAKYVSQEHPLRLEDDNKIRMIYSQKNRNEQSQNLTGFSTQPLPGCEPSMQTVYATEMITPEIEILESKKHEHNFRIRRLSQKMQINEDQRLTSRQKNDECVVGSRSIMNGNNQGAVVVLHAKDKAKSNCHLRTNTKALIEGTEDDLRDMQAKISVVTPTDNVVDRKVDQNLHISSEKGRCSNATVSQSQTRRSHTRSSMSMQAIREVQELLQQNQSTDLDREYMEYHIQQSPTTKELMLHAAMQGQPAQIVGQEIQRKREKMRALYMQGRRKLTGIHYHACKTRLNSQTRVASRPPTGQSAHRARSVLDQSFGKTPILSQSSISVQGNQLQNKQVILNPYVPHIQQAAQLCKIMAGSK